MKKILIGLSIVASLSFSAEDICIGLFNADDFQKSGDCYVKQIKKSSSVNNNFFAGASLIQQGRVKEALPYLQKAEKLASNESDLSLIYNWLSTAYSDLGNRDLELAYKMKYLNMSLKSNNKNEISKAYNNLGAYYYNMSDYNEALEYYNKSLEFKENKEKSTTYSNIAECYKNLENYDKANEFYNKSINVALNNGNYLVLCTSKTNFGIFLYSQEKYQEADKVLNEANNICHNAGNISSEANSFIGLGLSSLKQQDLQSAKSYYNQAKTLANKSGDSLILDNLADLEQKINSYNK